MAEWSKSARLLDEYLKSSGVQNPLPNVRYMLLYMLTDLVMIRYGFHIVESPQNWRPILNNYADNFRNSYISVDLNKTKVIYE